MIVPVSQFESVVTSLMGADQYSLDTETTGLRWYDKDRLFSVIISNGEKTFYFNFNDHFDNNNEKPHEEFTIPREWMNRFTPLLHQLNSTWFMHNAKFDLAMIAKEGLSCMGDVHCTEAMARLVDSRWKSYRLKECLSRMQKDLGRSVTQKSDAVEEFIKKNKLFRKVKLKGKEKEDVEKFFHMVPLDIIAPYGITDAKATWELGDYQRKKLWDLRTLSPNIAKVVHKERKITKVCFDMEQAGVKIDRPYVQKSLDQMLEIMGERSNEYIAWTGQKEFINHANHFKPYFKAQGITSPKKTPKGGDSFDKDALAEIDHPVAKIIVDWRKAQKNAGTYFSNFIHYSDEHGKIHAGVRQTGTVTGRMSYAEPNLQNIPKPDDDDPQKFKESKLVRSSFVPSSKDYCFFMPDYDQMEYRLMLDQAEEMGVIKMVLDGMDVHTAMAEMVGVTRKQAKTLNFMLLYGGGAQKLATALGVTLAEAKRIKSKYFARLGQVRRWMKRNMAWAARRGYNVNFAGRPAVVDKKFSYKSPNYDIQGGCADIMKDAMIEIHSLLQGTRSKMLIQVHDELILEMHKSELHLCPEIVKIMESVYDFNHLPLTAGPKYSWDNWAETKEGYPENAKAA